MTGNIKPICSSFSIGMVFQIDEEYRRIIRKLMQYGMKPTGNKSADKERLHRRELQEAEKESCVTSKFLTVSKAEQEKIQREKKEKRIENNPENFINTTQGQKLLGEQLMLAIKMKNKE